MLQTVKMCRMLESKDYAVQGVNLSVHSGSKGPIPGNTQRRSLQARNEIVSRCLCRYRIAMSSQGCCYVGIKLIVLRCYDDIPLISGYDFYLSDKS